MCSCIYVSMRVIDNHKIDIIQAKEEFSTEYDENAAHSKICSHPFMCFLICVKF